MPGAQPYIGLFIASVLVASCAIPAAHADIGLVTASPVALDVGTTVDDPSVLVDPNRPILAEWVYEPAEESGDPVDTDDDPSCVLRIYGMATTEMADGATRLSLPVQTRCAHKVEALEHKAQLVQEWSPWVEDGYPGAKENKVTTAADVIEKPNSMIGGHFAADKAPWEGWVEHVGPDGAADTPQAAGFWSSSVADARYLHQANVRVICNHTTQKVSWEAAVFGQVTFKGRNWAATPSGYSLESCWV